MKKKLLASLLLVSTATLMLTACNSDNGETSVRGNMVDVGDFEKGFDLMRDTRTGCIYIKENSTYSNGYYPYYDENGEVAGCGEEDLDKTKYE